MVPLALAALAKHQPAGLAAAGAADVEQAQDADDEATDDEAPRESAAKRPRKGSKFDQELNAMAVKASVPAAQHAQAVVACEVMFRVLAISSFVIQVADALPRRRGPPRVSNRTAAGPPRDTGGATRDNHAATIGNCRAGPPRGGAAE
eukprot:220403-Pyramimonas_sp.AAC.1